MPKRCVAFGCSSTNSDGTSLFFFPKDDILKQKWTKNVQRTRADWKGPTQYSVLCCKHFESECFEPVSYLAAQMGLKLRRKLKPEAVPTVFERFHKQSDQPGPSRKRSATDEPALMTAQSSKKPRQAFVKRERLRVSAIPKAFIYQNN